jgi:hypothetical protein
LAMDLPVAKGGNDKLPSNFNNLDWRSGREQTRLCKSLKERRFSRPSNRPYPGDTPKTSWLLVDFHGRPWTIGCR